MAHLHNITENVRMDFYLQKLDATSRKIYKQKKTPIFPEYPEFLKDSHNFSPQQSHGPSKNVLSLAFLAWTPNVTSKYLESCFPFVAYCFSCVNTLPLLFIHKPVCCQSWREQWQMLVVHTLDSCSPWWIHPQLHGQTAWLYSQL